MPMLGYNNPMARALAQPPGNTGIVPPHMQTGGGLPPMGPPPMQTGGGMPSMGPMGGGNPVPPPMQTGGPLPPSPVQGIPAMRTGGGMRPGGPLPPTPMPGNTGPMPPNFGGRRPGY